MQRPDITLEEFRHWLIEPNDRGFDESKLREPIVTPASAVHDGPCDRVCEEAPKLLWPALKALYHGGAMKSIEYVPGVPFSEHFLEDLESQDLSLDSSDQDVIDSGFLSEWPIELNEDMLEEVYRHVKTFDNLREK